MSESKKSFVMPEFTDQNMEKLGQAAKKIYDGFRSDPQWASSSDEDVLSGAVVMGIFAVFDPENLPMTEEQIDTIFRAYQDWLRKKYILN